MRRFVNALAGEPQDVPPVWFMRQAGRYQRSYQAKRKKYSFEQLCREPHLAAAVALDAAQEFDFDAAILFSDLLFPLNALGLPLRYDDGGPKLGRRLDDKLIGRLRPLDRAAAALAFQAEAVALTRYALPPSQGLIGFIGGPWTLFVYAVEGTHAGSLAGPKASMALYRKFARIIVPLLQRAAQAQLDAGADVVMVFDTAAGEGQNGLIARYNQGLFDLARQGSAVDVVDQGSLLSLLGRDETYDDKLAAVAGIPYSRDAILRMSLRIASLVRSYVGRIKKAVVLTDKSMIGPDDLELMPESLRPVMSLAEAKEEFQQRYVQEVLERNNGNRTKTARDLGVDPRTIFRYLEKDSYDA